MKKHYDFSAAKRNPYAKRLKQQLTIRLDTDTVTYFRTLAKENGDPVSNLDEPVLTRLRASAAPAALRLAG